VSAILSTFERLIDTITAEAHRLYGTRLECLAVFGSVGRGTMRADSDIDLLVVVEPLPNGRLARIEEFAPVETAVAPLLEQVRTVGVDTRISAVIRTPAEVRAGSPLMFDMTEDARILYDPRAVLRDALDDLRRRLDKLGARRIWRDGWWYWDLKPDLRPGETFEI
jgi:predicted nucleotidyltransferase